MTMKFDKHDDKGDVAEKINSIPVEPEIPKKKPQKHKFVVKKTPIKLSERVLNSPLLSPDFGEPVFLDTRDFHLLSYGLDKIYNRVNEDD